MSTTDVDARTGTRRARRVHFDRLSSSSTRSSVSSRWSQRTPCSERPLRIVLRAAARRSARVVVVMRLSRGSSGAAPYVEAGPRLSPMQVESWRLLREEYAADRAAQADRRASEAQRSRARPELAALLARFLTGELDVEALRATFDHRTKTD